MGTVFLRNRHLGRGEPLVGFLEAYIWNVSPYGKLNSSSWNAYPEYALKVVLPLTVFGLVLRLFST